MISGIAVDIFEEQGAEQRRCAEDGIAEVPATRQPVSLVRGRVVGGSRGYLLAQALTVLVVQRARHDEYAEFMGSGPWPCALYFQGDAIFAAGRGIWIL